MKKYLSIRLNNQKRKANELLVNEFIYCFTEQKPKRLEALLSFQYKYLDGKTKWELLDHFKTYWNMINEQGIKVEVEYGVALDYYPGCIAIKIKLIEFSGNKEFPSRLTLIPLFEGDYLSGLVVCKRCAPYWVINRLMRDN